MLDALPDSEGHSADQGQPAFTTPRPVTISKTTLLKLSGLPLHKAAACLGLGTTTMKNTCSELGISNWPYRKSIRTRTKTLSQLPQAPAVSKTNAPFPRSPSTLTSSITSCDILASRPGNIFPHLLADTRRRLQDASSRDSCSCYLSQEAAAVSRGSEEEGCDFSKCDIQSPVASAATSEVNEPSQSRFAIASILN